MLPPADQQTTLERGSGRHYEEGSARYAAAVLDSFLVADSGFTRAIMLGFWYLAQVYLVETYMRI
jgi:hypothetical protein